MISKKNKKAIALTLSIGVINSSIGVINLPTIAYAEETAGETAGNTEGTGVSNGENSEPTTNTQGTSINNGVNSEPDVNTEGTSISNGDDSETTFTKAETDLKAKIDEYIHDSEAKKDIKEVDMTSILNGFSYESEETTGSAVSIKAKDVSNFENDGNTLSFEGTLYEAKDGGNTYNFNYSKTYKAPALMLSASLLTSSGDSSWITPDDIKTVSYNVVTINGVEFELTDSTNNYVSVYGLADDITSDLILPDTITCGSTSYSVTSIVISERTGWAMIKLASIKIPRTVTSISENSLKNFSKLTNINVDEDNKNYASKDGVLFNKNLTVLLECPEDKEADKYKIPSSVTSIRDRAFSNCSSLTSIEIPSGVTSIGDSAFYGCSSLTSIEIPSSVTSIGVFPVDYYSNNLTVLRYKVSDNTIKITGIYTDSGLNKTYIGSNVTIPDTICGIKVTEIADGLFDSYTDSIQSITCYNRCNYQINHPL